MVQSLYTIGIILFDLMRLFGSAQESINKVCMTCLCLLWEGLGLGPTFYGDEIFLVSAHMYKGPMYLTVLEKYGQLLCNFSELRHSYKESWAFCVRIPTFKQRGF